MSSSAWNSFLTGQWIEDLLSGFDPSYGSAYRNFINGISDNLSDMINYRQNMAYAFDKDPSEIPSLVSQSVDDLSNYVHNISGGLLGKPISASSGSGSSGSISPGFGTGGSGNPVAPSYLHASLAQHYGMSSSTAYQEALSNTAYQRAVSDMKSAGLNPAVLFGAGRANSAQGVSHISRASGSSGGSATGDLVSPGMYNLISLIGGLAVSKVTNSPYGFYAGQTAAKSILNILSGK